MAQFLNRVPGEFILDIDRELGPPLPILMASGPDLAFDRRNLL
jgi:hypothetical protein